MPPQKEYEEDEFFKKYGRIPGHLYWQGRIVNLGRRKEDVDSDKAAVDLPEVSPTSAFVQFIF